MEIMQTVYIGSVVAVFLFNTERIVKSIGIMEECLALLNSKALETVQEYIRPLVITICNKLIDGYTLIYDHTSAIECAKKLHLTLQKSGQKQEEGKILLRLANINYQRSRHEEAKHFYEKALSIMLETGNNHGVGTCYGNLGGVFQAVGEYGKAEEYLQKAVTIRKEIGDKEGEASDYGNLGNVFLYVGQYTKAEEYVQKALTIRKEIGDKHGEASDYGNLGVVFLSVGQYTKAEEYLQRALAIRQEIGDKKGKALDYGNFGTLFLSVGQYTKAEEYLQKALAIRKEVGDKRGEASDYGNLGTLFENVGQYIKAEEYLQKALAIRKEICDKKGEASDYANLGTVFQSLGQYTKAEVYLEKALTIIDEIGDKEGQAACYGNLGTLFSSVGQYTKAEEYHQKALTIKKEIGDKRGEAFDYGNLGTVSHSVGQYTKAEDYFQKALKISKEIGDKKGEAAAYGNLGTFFSSVGQYTKAEEYLLKALTIQKEIGDKKGEATGYGNLGTMFKSVGQYTKAEEYHQKSLVLRKEIGDKSGEAIAYGNLGTVFNSVGQYTKAEEYLQKSLVISKEIGDKRGEGSVSGRLGGLFVSVGQYTKAEEYLKSAITINEEIGNKAGLGASYLNLVKVCQKFEHFQEGQEFAKKALEISYEIGDIELQFSSHFDIALNTLLAGGSIHEVVRNLYESIKKCEEIHEILRLKEESKISFFDEHVSPYFWLCWLCIAKGNYHEALYVTELGRSRALADILSDKYSVEKEVSVNPESWIGIENIMNRNALSSCLYVSCFHENMYFWILKPNKVIEFRQTKLKDVADKVFGNQTFVGTQELRQEQCEDRSLSVSSSVFLTTYKASQDEGSAGLRLIENEEDALTLSDGYKMIVALVADLLQEPEIIIVPDRLLYPIPFAALTDENGKYLSDTFRIRVVPSLTTLRLIQHSSADYHSKTGALIVGEPEVSDAYYQGKPIQLNPLPWARKEAEMIGQLLGVQPLLGRDATKQAVLGSMHSVSLIHFAAHGDAERGEIALSPSGLCGTIATEKEYLLTMAEIAQVRLTAKLVVLSCCHSARGQIRAEGVVGIARAFLASGARAVLAALWAVDDKATMCFMTRFYEHLVRGESVSESLHQAMKSMRENSFSDVREWAPFILIGDDVSFEGLYLIVFV